MQVIPAAKTTHQYTPSSPFFSWGEKMSEQTLRELYEVERTLSFILQSFTHISGLVQSNDSLKAIVHDLTDARDQLREIMCSMGWKAQF